RVLEERLRSSLLQRLETARRRLVDLEQRRCFRLPLERIRELERRVDESSERLQRSTRQRLLQLQDRLQGQAARLEGLSPLNVLGRGYSLTRKEVDQLVVRG